jgi:type IV pilus assembly protein PilY1
MHIKRLAVIAVILFALAVPVTGMTQALFQEDFTGATTNNNWFFFNGACLTAGTGTSTASPGIVPGCATVFGTYYGVADSTSGKAADSYMTGGYAGYMGASSAPTVGSPVSATPQTPDPILTDANGHAVGMGALRFTNGYPYGYHENGAIVSGFTVPSGQGIEITFKTTTYLGNSGGSGQDGADGISFYLLDGCMPVTGGAASGIAGAAVPSGCGANPIYGSAGKTFPAIGAWGGSLAYSCSNSNSPYSGLTGAYIGLGIDEYGNFLNGTSNTLSETGTSATGDNTASGGGYQPGRIGLRGAGSISGAALTTAYGTFTGSSSPYYPASLATTCSNGGTYSASTNSCGTVCTTGNPNGGKCSVCPAGTTFSSTAPTATPCGSCSAGGTYDPATNTCSAPAYTCPAGGPYIASPSSCTTKCSTGNYNSITNQCNVCSGSQVFDLTHASSSGTPCAACSQSGAYSSSTGKCSKGSLTWNKPSSKPAMNVPVTTLANVAGTTVSTTSGSPILPSAIQKTCSTGHLWNYSTPTAPTDVGAATLPNDPTNPTRAQRPSSTTSRSPRTGS